MAPSEVTVLSNEHLLSRLGVLIVDGFFEPAFCRELIAGFRSSPYEMARINQGAVAEQVRRTFQVDLDDELEEAVRGRLREVRPVLAAHFDVPLWSIENPNFLRYASGHRFRPHIDAQEATGSAARAVSASIFLNAHDTDGEAFTGGALVFTGLTTGGSGSVGIPVPARAGRLVAFRSTTRHEVQEISSGERYSVVSWFHRRTATGDDDAG